MNGNTRVLDAPCLFPGFGSLVESLKPPFILGHLYKTGTAALHGVLVPVPWLTDKFGYAEAKMQRQHSSTT